MISDSTLLEYFQRNYRDNKIYSTKFNARPTEQVELQELWRLCHSALYYMMGSGLCSATLILCYASQEDLALDMVLIVL